MWIIHLVPAINKPMCGLILYAAAMAQKAQQFFKQNPRRTEEVLLYPSVGCACCTCLQTGDEQTHTRSVLPAELRFWSSSVFGRSFIHYWTAMTEALGSGLVRRFHLDRKLSSASPLHFHLYYQYYTITTSTLRILYRSCVIYISIHTDP